MPPKRKSTKKPVATKKSAAKSTASHRGLPVITAYDLRTKQSGARMTVKHIYKKPILDKEGNSTGKYRFRFAGTAPSGQNMSVFTSEEKAKAYASASGMKITTQAGTVPGPRKERTRLTCKVIAKRHADCIKRAAKRAAK